MGFHAATTREFQKYSWPGNVRELRNVIERNLILNGGPIFRAELPSTVQDKKTSLRRLDEVDTKYLRNVFQSTHWRVRGPGGAAEVLGRPQTDDLGSENAKAGHCRREEYLQRLEKLQSPIPRRGSHSRVYPFEVGETLLFVPNSLHRFAVSLFGLRLALS